MIRRRLVIMQKKAKPTNDLFDGCNLSAPLLRFVLVPVGDCLDLLLHSVAHAEIALLITRQEQQSHQQQSCTHQVNLCHAAVVLQTLRNHTTASISQLVVAPLHHTPLHVPPPPSLPQPHVTPSTAAPLLPSRVRPSSPPLTHAPAYQVDLLQALEPPQVGAQRRNVVVLQLLQRVWCELNVSGGGRGCGRQVRDATHVTQHHEARENAHLSGRGRFSRRFQSRRKGRRHQ